MHSISMTTAAATATNTKTTTTTSTTNSLPIPFHSLPISSESTKKCKRVREKVPIQATQQTTVATTDFEKLLSSSYKSSSSSSPSYSSSLDSFVQAMTKGLENKSKIQEVEKRNISNFKNNLSFDYDDDDDNSTGSVGSASTETQESSSIPLANANTTTVLSKDKERQMLLLMLLAQVCSLHDATPKTFTVHVMNLLERGIINKDCVTFLLELGLVPFGHNEEEVSRLIAASTTPATAPSKANNNNPSPTNPCNWSVEQHPLSLSRYQREFIQIRLLNSGSFGDVYQVKNNLDGVEYAMKKVMFPSVGFDTTTVQNIIREVQCLAKCDHVNCVRYYTSWLEPSWMTGGSVGTCASDGIAATSHIQRSTQRQLQPLALPPPLKTWEDEVNWVEHQLEECSSLPITRKQQCYHPKEDSSPVPFDFDDDDDDNYSEWSYAEDSMQQNIPTALTSSNAPYRYNITLYIQMQLCHPSTLSDWIIHRNNDSSKQEQRVPQLSLTSEINIFRQIVAGVHHFHSKQIVHRDLKPANIFLAEDGTVKIGDFGLSKIMQQQDSQHPMEMFHSSPTPLVLKELPHAWNSSSNIGDDYPQQQTLRQPSSSSNSEEHNTIGIGTVSYAAPEQIHSNIYGPKADIYSLGIILLELVNVFQTAHERASAFQLCRDANRKPLDLPFLSKNIPKTTIQNISSLILDCTNADPTKRPDAKTLNHFVKLIQNDISPRGSSIDSTSLTTYNCTTTDSIIRIHHHDTTKSIEYNHANSSSMNSSNFDDEVQMLKIELHKSQSEIELQKKQLKEKDLLILELQMQVQNLRSSY